MSKSAWIWLISFAPLLLYLVSLVLTRKQGGRSVKVLIHQLIGLVVFQVAIAGLNYWSFGWSIALAVVGWVVFRWTEIMAETKKQLSGDSWLNSVGSGSKSTKARQPEPVNRAQRRQANKKSGKAKHK